VGHSHVAPFVRSEHSRNSVNKHSFSTPSAMFFSFLPSVSQVMLQHIFCGASFPLSLLYNVRFCIRVPWQHVSITEAGDQTVRLWKKYIWNNCCLPKSRGGVGWKEWKEDIPNTTALRDKRGQLKSQLLARSRQRGYCSHFPCH